MLQMKSQHWLFGLLGLISIGSVFYTAFIGNIGLNPTPEREVESQDTIDTLTSDMKRLMQSVSNWEAFCEDPYNYLKSADSHGTFRVSIRDQWTSEEISQKNHITRDAIARCMKGKETTHPAQVRLCLTVKDMLPVSGDEKSFWFDDSHLLEVNVEFREKGAKLLPDCKNLTAKRVEVQSYFSAYTDLGAKKKAGRVSGGIRLPLESARL